MNTFDIVENNLRDNLKHNLKIIQHDMVWDNMVFSIVWDNIRVNVSNNVWINVRANVVNDVWINSNIVSTHVKYSVLNSLLKTGL